MARRAAQQPLQTIQELLFYYGETANGSSCDTPTAQGSFDNSGLLENGERSPAFMTGESTSKPFTSTYGCATFALSLSKYFSNHYYQNIEYYDKYMGSTGCKMDSGSLPPRLYATCEEASKDGQPDMNCNIKSEGRKSLNAAICTNERCVTVGTDIVNHNTIIDYSADYGETWNSSSTSLSNDNDSNAPYNGIDCGSNGIDCVIVGGPNAGDSGIISYSEDGGRNLVSSYRHSSRRIL